MPAWGNARTLNRYKNWLLLIIMAGLLVVSVQYLLQSQLFPVRQITITGKLNKVSNEQLQLVAKDKVYNSNVLTLDLNQVQRDFEQLPWVKKAEVKRLWPDQLEVRITEREALARGVTGGLIDKNGEWFDAFTDEKLPILNTPKGMEKHASQMYQKFLPLLNFMGEGIKELQLSDRNAWQLVMNNGLVVKLGHQDPLPRLQRMAKLWKKYLKVKEFDIEYIDLRYPDGFALKLKENDDQIKG